MKKLLSCFVLLFVTSVIPLTGCNPGPGTATEEEGMQGMDEMETPDADLDGGGEGDPET